MQMDITDINLRHLRMFMVIADEGSLNRVAASAGLSQPALSVAMTKLEERFGHKLLTRHASGTRATPAGILLRNRVQRMNGQLGLAIAAVLGAAARRDPGVVTRAMDRLTIRQFQALITLAGSGSLTEAAQRKGNAIGTIHRLLHDLQGNIGRTILVRGPGGLTVNAIGRGLAQAVYVALTEINQAEDELNELEGRMEGRVKIACLPLARTRLLARALKPLLMTYPEAQVQVVDGPYDVLQQLLRAGNCDILIGALRSGTDLRGLHAERLFDEPYAIICRSGHPLLGLGRPVEPADLLSMKWVVQRPGTPIRAAFDALFRNRVGPPKASVETSSLVLTRALLMESDRLSVLSRHQIAVEEEAGLMCCLPLSSTLRHLMRARTIGFTTRDNWLPSRLQAAFLDRLRAVARESFGA